MLQIITFRLADSLPQTKLRELDEELAHLPDDDREVQRRKTIDAWLDSGMGCCALRNPEVADYLRERLFHGDGEQYRLLVWVIMPNHVHVLVEPLAPLSKIVQAWKSISSRWMLKANARLGLGIPEPDRVWMREYWDRFIRDERHLNNAISYIHENPVKAGLCRDASEWRWSSALRADEGVGNAHFK